MAGKPQNALLPDGDEAGDGLPGKRYIDFAGPGLAEILPDPGDDLVLFRRKRAPRRDGRLAQALKHVAGGRQRVQLDQHVHGRRLPSRGQLVHYRCWASTRKSAGGRLMAGGHCGVQLLATPFNPAKK